MGVVFKTNIIMKPAKLFLISTCLVFSSCYQELTQPKENQTMEDSPAQEEAFPGKTGEVISFEGKNGENYSYQKIDGYNVFEGDMLLSDAQIDALKKDDSGRLLAKKVSAAPAVARGRWSNSTMYYKISNSAKRTDIEWAINHIKSFTNVDFVEGTGSGHYVDFVSVSEGCSSYVGMKGGRQEIKLESNCSKGNIAHEILHALGLYHEQSRTDRNQYITIHTNNILPNKVNNFETRFVHNFRPFDFGSIMMYGPYAFTDPEKGGLPTITKKDGSLYTHQRSALSWSDRFALNDMYPGPNKMKIKNGATDIGVNIKGDVAYLKTSRFSLDVYKNDVKIASHRTNRPVSVDITSNGSVITNLDGYFSTSGKYHFKSFDISEGNGKIYCLASNTKTVNLYKKNGSSWTLIASNTGGKRITVDSYGRPWVLLDRSVRRYSDNGSYSTVPILAGSDVFDRFIDIGNAGNKVYATIKNFKHGYKRLVKYSDHAQQFIRQPGHANFIDGRSNGTFWTTL